MAVANLVRHIGRIALDLAAACSQQVPKVAKATCRLPVSWSAGQDVYAGFVSLPTGTLTDAGHPPAANPELE